ncbi:hypothetical protein SAMN04488528_1009122 [Clostridium frigidicarnis]|uniref:Uncharacterized protein n=1 Tax=Clostridium frigidicarnis TaxID=84698 RepID=A0A1I0XRN2_9CLOT|nr:hypothetical protein SAMN04488528_1009122 [Clostridium frigidicarnis]
MNKVSNNPQNISEYLKSYWIMSTKETELILPVLMLGVN